MPARTSENVSARNDLRFKRLLSMAREIADRCPDALIDYVRLLGGKLQRDYMLRVLANVNPSTVPSLEPDYVWFSELEKLDKGNNHLGHIKQRIYEHRKLSLATDLVLPTPWSNDRIVNTISSIGDNRRWGSWQQDDFNHRIEYWLPFGIGWVYGGNHSLTVGVLQSTGEVEAEEIYDLSPVFELVHFDGTHFIRNHDGYVLSRPPDLEFATLFEVGRLMHQYGVSA